MRAHRIWAGLVALVLAVTMSTTASAVAQDDSLHRPRAKELAQILVSTAENSSRDWRAQYSYIEYNVEHDPEENRGYTGGIIGFTSRTHDMLAVVRRFERSSPGSRLGEFLPALRRVDGTSSREGLGRPYVRAWRAAAEDPAFRRAQDHFRDRWYFDPAVRRARRDGLRELGQLAYYDAAVVHGLSGLREVRDRAIRHRSTPHQGGGERAYLGAFLRSRVRQMRQERAHQDVTRVTTMQRTFLRRGRLTLRLPLTWRVYGDRYRLTEAQLTRYRRTGRFGAP